MGVAVFFYNLLVAISMVNISIYNKSASEANEW